MNTTQTTYSDSILGKCTMYFIDGLGAYSKIELASAKATIELVPNERFGQKKLVVRSVKKGCRKPDASGYRDHMGIVFVEGWNTFAPALAFDASGESKVCFDEAYSSDFDRALAASGAKIVADYRGFNKK